MSFRKYVEIEWQEIRLEPFKDWGETNLYLNVADNYPAQYSQNKVSEKLISDLEQKQLEDQTWVVKPKNYSDRILYSGYVENLLQVAVSVLESDKNSILNKFSSAAGKLSDITKIPGKLFPYFGISSLVFSGIASLIKDVDDFLGSFVYQVRRDTIIPIGRPMIGEIRKADKKIGEIDLGVYIKPEGPENAFFYRDVEIFPYSANEIAVYYSGDLTNSEQVYIIWTLDSWRSNPLLKMKKWGGYWMALIEIPSYMEVGSQLEIAFTDDDQHWDNKDGNNWVFEYYRWI